MRLSLSLPTSGPVLLLCLAGLFMTGCATSGGARTQIEGETDRTWTSTEAESRLRRAAEHWDGAPHEWGGQSRNGVDCSGLVQSVFVRQFQVRLPRTTERQAAVGARVSRSQLRPGDLVFFRPGWKKRHVGIYLSDGKFLHASSSEGVTVSPLDRSYWTEHWWHARRVLSYGDVPPRAAADTSTEDTVSSRPTGW